MNKLKISEEKIDKLANLAIKRGVGLQKGQDLLITAPLESLPLVRKIAEHAYKEGAHLVTPLFTDSDILYLVLSMPQLSLLIMQLIGFLMEWGRRLITIRQEWL